MKRAVIYARVSTDDQAERGYSLPSQIDACHEYATRNGFTVIKEFKDDFSGAKLDRPEFTKLRALVNNREIEVVVVLSSDRLTRNLAHALILREELQHANVELHYVRRGKSEDTPESRMMENIEGVFNEYWREKIAEASRRGLHKKAESGKVVGQGGVPYGYRMNKDTGNLEIHEAESEVIRLIYQWYVMGDELGTKLSQCAIALSLSQMGVDTPGVGVNRRRRKRARNMWNEYTLKIILTNETYAGVWRYGKFINGIKRTIRPIDERLRVAVPSIISHNLWLAAQDQRKINIQMAPRAAKRQYLLRGMIRCQKCGRAMVGSARTYRRTTNEKRRYYYCTGVTEALTGLEQRCKQRMIHADVIESAVWQYVVELMSDENRFRQGLLDAHEAEKVIIQPRLDELGLITRMISEREQEVANIASQLTKLPPNGIVSNALQTRAQTIEQEYASLNERKKELLQLISTESLTETDITSAIEFRRRVIDGMADSTFDDKRNILQALQVKVLVNDSQTTIMCVIQTPDRQQLAVDTPK